MTDTTTARYTFRVYAVGLCRASVCTSLTTDEAAARLNLTNPTGIPSPWSPSPDTEFANGGVNPRPCDTWPDTHRHILFDLLTIPKENPMTDTVDENGDPQRSAAGPPNHWDEIPFGMSNLDHAIDPGFEDALRAGNVYGRHAAWNFNGIVWFEAGRFHEWVWVHKVPAQTLSANTLEELMADVNAEYGWE